MFKRNTARPDRCRPPRRSPAPPAASIAGRQSSLGSGAHRAAAPAPGRWRSTASFLQRPPHVHQRCRSPGRGCVGLADWLARGEGGLMRGVPARSGMGLAQVESTLKSASLSSLGTAGCVGARQEYPAAPAGYGRRRRVVHRRRRRPRTAALSCHPGFTPTTHSSLGCHSMHYTGCTD